MEIDKDDLLIISCIFGDKFQRVYQAPLGKNCFFFTNNTGIKQEIENKNWNFVYVPFELSSDSITSSCQSKYIKFLAFLDDYPEYKKYKTILYFDHKVFVKEEHIDKLISISNQENNQYSVIIRSHETQPRTLWDEVEAAKGQERYLNSMKETLELVNYKIKNNELNENIKICNTGLLFYVNYQPIKDMLDSIYKSCIQLRQPECQIFWAVYSQPFLNNIKFIDFYTLDLLWKEPFVSNEDNVIRNQRNLLFIIEVIIVSFFFVLLFFSFSYFVGNRIIKKIKYKKYCFL